MALGSIDYQVELCRDGAGNPSIAHVLTYLY
jgi:hypothetical protein